MMDAIGNYELFHKPIVIITAGIDPGRYFLQR
jgi:hypothetical protein